MKIWTDFSFPILLKNLKLQNSLDIMMLRTTCILFESLTLAYEFRWFCGKSYVCMTAQIIKPTTKSEVAVVLFGMFYCFTRISIPDVFM